MRVIFMGTPQFAVPTLKALLKSKHEIVAVYTKPPKPSGRGKQLIKSPIHLIAEEYGITVRAPLTLKTEEEISLIKKSSPEAIVVAAYGLILRPEVLSIPLHGCINIHPSDLPRWRGAAPIQRTILAGDQHTAMCIMKMDAGLDTGDVILRKQLIISDDTTAHQLHNTMSELGATMLLEALEELDNGIAKPEPQSSEGITYAQKLSPQDELINFNKSAFQVNCQIRALSPKPAAHFIFKNEKIKIITAEYTTVPHNYTPGLVIDDKLTISCKEGLLKPILLQRPGRKMIYTDAFLRGFNIPQGTLLANY